MFIWLVHEYVSTNKPMILIPSMIKCLTKSSGAGGGITTVNKNVVCLARSLQKAGH